MRLKGYPTQFPSTLIADQHFNNMHDQTKLFIKNIGEIEVESVEIGWRPLPLDGLPIIGFLNSL